MINDIQEHFEKEYPREACGVIGIVKGKKQYFPCNNLAKEDEDFILDPTDYISIKRKADIFAIVHNHIDSTNEASDNDKKYCNSLGIPYYIFSFPGMNLNILEPEVKVNPLIGREYEFGKFDCLELSRDYYREYLGLELPKRLPYVDDWWEYGHNYFTDEHIKEWGFKKVDDLQPNDLLIFTMGALVPNHCGVYTGNDIFFHHAANRLSCRENLYPLWKKYLTGIYRYET